MSSGIEITLAQAKLLISEFQKLEVKCETFLGLLVMMSFSKIQLVVYYQCRVLIGWATTMLYDTINDLSGVFSA